tara:strand:- start:230 stop:2143 length:1914 start_codon:yes stop_codon:yes gene_type:complete
MGGGLMQLVAYGAQDVYLTGNPQITFWKVTYRRHTNFAMESIEQTFNGQADFGRRVTCTISRNGDLAYRTYLQVTLPEINQQMANSGSSDVYARWLDFPGEQIISQVEVEIGGQRIDRQYGDWMHIWNQLTLSAEQERGYHQMIGNTTALTYITDPSFNDVDGPCESTAPRQVCAPRNALPETTLYIPFQFWYCRNPGLALPLIALQYHEVKINLDIRPTDECLWAVSTLECASSQNIKVTTAYAQSLVAASLYVDYVFLDTDERRRMAQNPHEYLIEQLQFTGDESVGSSSNKIKLNFNHPCKELVWVVQPDENVDYCASLECTENLYKLLGAQPFNYTDAVDALPNAIHAFSTQSGLVEQNAAGTNVGFISEEGLFQQAGPVGFSIMTCVSVYQLAITAAAGNQATVDALTKALNIILGTPNTPAINAADANLINTASTISGVAANDDAAKLCAAATASPLAAFVSNGAGWNSTDGVQAPLGGQVGRTYGAPNFGVDNESGQMVGVSDAGTFVLSETALTMHCWGQNPVVTAKLQLNGQDRFSEREGTYFDLVQPFQHHTRNPDTGINLYSFALRPEEHQPSGTCNFSRIDNATLQLVLSNATVEGTKTAKVRVYATNYNVLRVMSGMGGLAYSN